MTYSTGVKTTENEGPQGRESGIRKHNPWVIRLVYIWGWLKICSKTYGSIPDVQVGTWWETREGCSSDSIHAFVHPMNTLMRPIWLFRRPWVAGISSGPQGAYSVALSGGYEDDVDLGYALWVSSSLRNLLPIQCFQHIHWLRLVFSLIQVVESIQWNFRVQAVEIWRGQRTLQKMLAFTYNLFEA